MSISEETRERFAQEEQAYWQQRDNLLKQYNGKWVAIVGGKVVGVADQMNKAAAEAFRNTDSNVMYVNLVGREDVVLRVRSSWRIRARNGRLSGRLPGKHSG